MPRVIVTIDQDERPTPEPVVFSEYVDSVHLDSDHSAMQFVERLGWAISDAEKIELARSNA